jgi:DNA-3-methyladenine glycosylase II
MSSFTIEPQGAFSLAEAGEFIGGWSASDRHLHVAFLEEETWRPAGICLTESGGLVRAECFGSAPAAGVERQVRRMLSLDVDGRGWPKVAARDEVIANLQRMYPGFRPVLWASAYEAAAWSIISARISMRQAARVKNAMAKAVGATVSIHGEEFSVFPPPSTLAGLESFPGLFGRKVEYLNGLARLALEGALHTDGLRRLPAEAPMRRLLAIPGIGPFGAQLIWLRAVGDVEGVPSGERRLDRAVEQFYGPGTTVAEMAKAWSPYTMWACVSLRRALGEGPGMAHLNGAATLPAR